MNPIFKSPDHVRSRRAYALECSFEYAVTLLVTDVFLAKLLTTLGLTDTAVGIVASLFNLAYLAQFLSIFVVRKFKNTKRVATVGHLVGQILFCAIYLIPFLPFAKEYRGVLVVIFLLVAYSLSYFFSSMVYKWGNSFVDPNHRAEYSAGKEMISLTVGVVLTLIMGWVMDRFEALDNLDGAFIFFAAAIFIFSACDIVCLLVMKKEYRPKNVSETVRAPFSEVIRGTLGNKNFRRLIFMHSLFSVASSMTIGFLGTYQLNARELAFSVGAVQVFNLLGNAARFLLSRPLGRYADRTSFARGLKLAFSVAAAAFAINIFTTPATRYLMIVFIILWRASQGGTSANIVNITYSYVDQRYFTEACAIKNGIAATVAFLGSLLGGRLLAAVQAGGNTLLGMTVYGQQILSAISAVLLLIGVLFLHFVIEKQTVMKQ